MINPDMNHTIEKTEADAERQSPVPSKTGRRLARMMTLTGYVTGILLTLVLVVIGFNLFSAARGDRTAVVVATQEAASTAAVSYQRPVVTEDELLQKVGIQIVYIAVTGGGGLVDLRFRVIDTNKADAVHDPVTPPIVIDEDTGIVVDSLLMGHEHSAPFNAGQTYYLIFENPGNVVQRGGKVSILLGNTEIDHIPVQ